MSEFNQNQIARTVWPWRDAGKAKEKQSAGNLRRVLTQFAVMAGIGWILFFPADRVIMGCVAWGLALIVLISGLFIPPVFRAIERFGKRLGQGAATGITWLLLVPFFYIVFAPIHLLSRLKGKDPLCRKFPTDAPTYWIPRPPVKNAEHYRKQH